MELNYTVLSTFKQALSLKILLWRHLFYILVWLKDLHKFGKWITKRGRNKGRSLLIFLSLDETFTVPDTGKLQLLCVFFFSACACVETGLLLFLVCCLYHLLCDVCVDNMTLLAHELFMVFPSTCISLSPFFPLFLIFICLDFFNYIFFLNLFGILVSDAFCFCLERLLLACSVVNNEFIFTYFSEVRFWKAFSFFYRIE